MRVLLIASDSGLLEQLEVALLAEGFKVSSTDSGQEGIDLAKLYDYDVLIVSFDIPDIRPVAIATTLRVARRMVPILFLTSDAASATAVASAAIEGAYDQLAEPFMRSEIVQKVTSLERLSKKAAQSIIETGPICLNLDTKTVTVSGRRLHLTGKEYQILELLSLRKGKTLTKEMFLNHLYGGMDEPELKIVDVFICKLRKKLQIATGGRHYIATVWGRGYVLTDAEEEIIE